MPGLCKNLDHAPSQFCALKPPTDSTSEDRPLLNTFAEMVTQYSYTTSPWAYVTCGINIFSVAFLLASIFLKRWVSEPFAQWAIVLSILWACAVVVIEDSLLCTHFVSTILFIASNEIIHRRARRD